MKNEELRELPHEKLMELYEGIPAVTFPAYMTVQMLPPHFPEKGELFRFRIRCDWHVISVIGWRDHFEAYHVTTLECEQIMFSAEFDRPGAFINLLVRMINKAARYS